MAPAQFSNLNFVEPFIVDEGPVRSLHFTLGETQSSMRLDRPDELQIDYTRTMMGFLLLHPHPRRIAMVGLGGGSLVKFCRRHLPRARLVVVENNPGVLALRHQFCIPDDDDRLSVVEDDGAVFVAGLHSVVDVLLVDAFDHAGQPPQLCTQAFYDASFAALAPGGVFAVNLHHDHPEHELLLQRIAASFKGNAMQVVTGEQANCVVFARRDGPVSAEALRDRQWTRRVDEVARRQLSAEFAHIGWVARALPGGPHADGNAG